MDWPTVTVMLITYDRPEEIRRTIYSLLKNIKYPRDKLLWHISDDNSPGNAEIYYKKSTDGGSTWTTKRLTNNSGNSYSPAIALDSNNYIQVAWYDYIGGDNQIFHKRSTNGGATWTTKRLTYSSGGSVHPAITTDSGNNIHVVWHGNAPGNNEIFYKKGIQ